MKTRVTTVKQKVRLPASPEKVYEAFMDAKKHIAFTGSKATSNPKVGGRSPRGTVTSQEKTLNSNKESA